MSFWQHKRLLVTGGSGFLGSVVVRKLNERGCNIVTVPRSSAVDLRDRNAVRQFLRETHPDIVIHLAASVGGIGANLEQPAEFFFDNAIMGLELIHASYLEGIEKFVCIGTICSYPKFTPVPFREDALWDGYPEETNAPYGLAKKMLLVQLQAYRQQYGFNGVYLLPVNLYGPGDNFDPRASHVIPALIKKCVDAVRSGQDRIIAWGSGAVTREFLYVDDAAEGILLAAERYDKAAPVNIGAGYEIKIRDLAARIAAQTEFAGEIVWDPTRPDGQPRRMLDTTLAEQEFGFGARISLDEGLRRTVQWYLSQ